MTILNIQTSQAGLSGTLPSIAYINTNDTEAAVLTAGYLNEIVSQGFQFALPCIAAISTRTTPSAQPDVGWYEIQHSGGSWSAVPTASPGSVTLPTIANHIATYTNTSGNLSEDPSTAISGGNLQAGLATGTAGTLISMPSSGSKGSFIVKAISNTGNTNTTLSNDAMGQASVINIPDPANAIGQLVIGATATPFVSGNFPKNSGTAGLMVDSGLAVSAIATTSTAVLLTPAGDQSITIHNLTVAQGNLQAGSDAHAGTLASFPATTGNGSLIISALNAGGAFTTTLRNSTMGQSSVISLPDPGAATAKVLLDTGTGATATITKISTGATPVPLVDPGSCTISGAAGASTVCNVSIQLKDGAGSNIARVVPFTVYSSSAADGLTLQSAASTGYAVSAGGLSLANGSAVTTQIHGVTSASGACTLTLTDSGKQTSYLVLVLNEGIKISAQLSAGSYGA